MNENHSKSNLWTGVALAAGIVTIGTGLAEYRSLVKSIGGLGQEDQVKGMLNAGERLGQILTPDNSARTIDLITVGKETMDSIHTLGMLVGTWVSQFIHSGTVSMSSLSEVAGRVNSWEVVIPLGGLILVGAMILSAGEKE